MNDLEAKTEVKTTAKYIQFDALARTATKRCNAETGQVDIAGNTKILTRALYKTATTLQQYNFVLLSKHIPVMPKSHVDLLKLKMLSVLFYFSKYKFQFLLKTQYL